MERDAAGRHVAAPRPGSARPRRPARRHTLTSRGSDVCDLRPAWEWGLPSSHLLQDDVGGMSRPPFCPNCGRQMHPAELQQHVAACLRGSSGAAGFIPNNPRASFATSRTGRGARAPAAAAGAAGPAAAPPSPTDGERFCAWRPCPGGGRSSGASQAGPGHFRDGSGAAPCGGRHAGRPASAPRAGWRSEGSSGAPPPLGGGALDGLLLAHEAAWERFFSCDALGILYEDVPWPDAGVARPNALLLHGVQCAAEGGSARATLRKLQVRWHPDKWSQRFASRLCPSHAERILGRVKDIAQHVNSLRRSFA